MSLLRGLASAVACAATPGVSPDAIQPLDLEGGEAGSGGADDEVMVFLLAGQSNMVGRGNGTALSKSLLRRLHSLSDPKKGDCPIGYYAAGLAGAGSTSYNASVCSMMPVAAAVGFNLRLEGARRCIVFARRARSVVAAPG